MSSGADCQFIEVQPGRWRVRLQEWPYGDTEEYIEMGPFGSYSLAVDALNNHQNPGGWMNRFHPDHDKFGHEWETERGAYVQNGVEVTVRIESLGATPSTEAILARLAKGDLTADMLKVKPTNRWDPSIKVTKCVACQKEKVA